MQMNIANLGGEASVKYATYSATFFGIFSSLDSIRMAKEFLSFAYVSTLTSKCRVH